MSPDSVISSVPLGFDEGSGVVFVTPHMMKLIVRSNTYFPFDITCGYSTEVPVRPLLGAGEVSGE